MTSHKAGHDAEKIRPGIRMTTEIRPLPAFEYLTPSSVIEALAALETHGEAAKLLSGGTDLLLRMKKQKSTPSVLVDLNGISELEFIELRGSALHIGAGTRLALLHESSLVHEKAAALAEAVRVMSSPAIRNRATIGGNLCNASRCADTQAPLLALDARLTLRSPRGERTVQAASFFTAPGNGSGKTVMQVDEILTEVTIPIRRGGSAFVKLGRRRGSSTAIISAAAFATISNGIFEQIRVAVSGFGSTPIRSRKVESALNGRSADVEAISTAAVLIKDEIDPISDERASAAYRKEMAPVVIRRALARVAIGE
jgi:carbon-monoxide dehydrogenase medium subunit